MGRPHSMALRQRGVAVVEEGSSHCPAAAWFQVSVRLVNDMVILKRETSGLALPVQGHGGGHGKWVAVGDPITARKPDLTPNDLMGELADHRGIAIHRCLGLEVFARSRADPQKDLQALEQKRPEIRQAISASRDGNRSCAARRRVSASSTRRRRRQTWPGPPDGLQKARLVNHAPFGHCNTRTFIAARRHDRLDARRG